jgi:hypothetical protein
MKPFLPLFLALVLPVAAHATGAVSISSGGLTLELKEAPALNTPKTVTLTRSGDTSAAVDVTVTATPTFLTPVSAAVAVLECRPDAVSAWKPLYWGGSLTATIPAGAADATFQIRSRNNEAYEVRVGGVLMISQLSGAATGVGEGQMLSIEDDDTDLSLWFSPMAFPEGSGTTPVLHQIQVTASRPVALTGPLPIFMTVFGGASGVGADEFSDFRVPFGMGPQGLLPYGNTFSVGIEIVPDTVWEGNETFFIQSMMWHTGSINVGPQTMFTITDDEDPVVASVSVSPSSVTEGGPGTTSPMTFTIALNQPAPVEVGVALNITGTAQAGVDYNATDTGTGWVTIPQGEVSRTIVLPVTGDSIPEADETLEVTIAPLNGLAPFKSPAIGTATAQGTILNDDGQRTLVVQATSPTVVEGGVASLSLTLSNIVGISPVSPRPSVIYTVNAPAGTTVSPSSGLVRFISGSPQYIAITIGNDTVPEPDAEVSITFTDPSGLVVTQATVPLCTVVDDDRYTLSVSSPSVLEGHAGGSSVLAFNVSIPIPALDDLVFQYATAPGTAGAGDFTAASGTATIPAGQTMAVVAVMVTGDAAVEPDETLQLSVSSSDPFATPGSFSGTGTILHDDFAGLPVPGPTLVTEAQGSQELLAWFAVKMPAHPFPVTCTVTTRDGTAVAGIDYQSVNGSLTFAQGETQKWVAVRVTPGTAAESTEQFFLDVLHQDSGTVRSSACTIERLSIAQFWQIIPGLYAVRFPTGLGQRYIVYESPVIDGTWTPTSSILTGTGFPVTQTLFSEAPKSFYRVELAPPLPPGTAAVGP